MSIFNALIYKTIQMSFTELLSYWFPNSGYQEFWFSGTKDNEIYDKFSGLLKSCELLSFSQIIEDCSSDSNKILAYVILFDQITRNISRIDNGNFRRNDNTALQLSNIIIEKKYDELYPVHKLIFCFLPFRHSRTTENLDFVIGKINHIMTERTLTLVESKLMDRYWTETIKDYSKVTDTIVTYDNTSLTYTLYDHPSHNQIIHDDNCKNYILPSCDFIESIITDPLYISVKKFIIERKITRIGISLSGGVDSNVLMYILYKLREIKLLDVLVAIHVDYGNRDISNIEAKYLFDVCEYFKIPMITRRIEHIKRSNTKIDRAVYEEETKKIRFGLYKYAMKLYNIEGVCLGHHSDDLMENVFMNIMRGKDLMDLFVMVPVLTFDTVNIMRPMLDHPKSDIYRIANNYGIMYFKDTTSDSCFRGTIRKKIFPAIESFDSSMLKNLMFAGKRSTEWNSVVQKVAMKPILKSLCLGKTGFRISFDEEFAGLPSVFWSKLLLDIFHGNGVKMIKNKNLLRFVEWTNSKNISNVMLRLSNGMYSVNEKNMIYFFHNSVIRGTFNMNDEFPNIVPSKDTKIGKWKIQIEQNSHEYLTTPMTLDDLLRGNFSYTIPTGNFKIVQYINKHDRTCKMFKKLHGLSYIVPKCISIHQSEKCNDFKKYNNIYTLINYSTKYIKKIYGASYILSKIYSLLYSIFHHIYDEKCSNNFSKITLSYEA